ncbi:TetR/AcrR family transcriptional regulator [Pseudoalteromonas ruthenica]|uniref:TetR/AcrR family transcriptional regulator n=1 Tax=Pseudoalteromonas ruthenica TaxID=151081 RepID=UPI0012489550|nr:TetR/AcrR family transcriptional regulator [Pseudoalteromonas ruthenica]
MSTKDRIIQASIELSNSHGERAITTNHIAAHLQISPGNLCYHFKNKEDIIRHIFKLYRQHLDTQFKPINHDEPVMAQLTHYFDALFELMWKFHFFYDNMTDILSRDAELKADYITFQQRLFDQVKSIVLALGKNGILEIDEEQAGELTHMLKLTVSFWTPYIKARRQSGELNRGDIYQGLLKIITLFMAFTTAAGREPLGLLKQHYQQRQAQLQTSPSTHS